MSSQIYFTYEKEIYDKKRTNSWYRTSKAED